MESAPPSRRRRRSRDRSRRGEVDPRRRRTPRALCRDADVRAAVARAGRSSYANLLARILAARMAGENRIDDLLQELVHLFGRPADETIGLENRLEVGDGHAELGIARES